MAPGDVVSHYRIDSPLGGGGMGVVYLAGRLPTDEILSLGLEVADALDAAHAGRSDPPRCQGCRPPWM